MFSRAPRRSQASENQILKRLDPRNKQPKPKGQTLPENDETAGAEAIGAQTPVEEAELVDAGPEAERAAPPRQRRAIQTGRLIVASRDVRVHDRGHGRLQSAGKENLLRERRHLLPIRRDGEPLQNGREVERHNRARCDRREERLVTTAFGHRNLARERTLPVVIELPARELGFVGVSHGGEEHFVERLAVVGHPHLREDDRQEHALEKVDQELVALHPPHDLRSTPLEFLSRDRRLAVREVARQALQAFGEVHLRLDEVEVAVGVHHRGHHALRRDAPAVTVEEHPRDVLDLRDLGAGDERVGDLFAAERVQERFNPSGPAGILCHVTVSFQAESPKSVLPLPVARGLLTTRSTL